MLKIEKNHGVMHHGSGVGSPSDVLSLNYEQRTKGRLRAVTKAGQDVGLFLERGKTLKNGELLEAVDGQIIQIEASSETLVKGSSDNWHLFARCCYHLGNRHVPIQIGECELWIQADHILKDMLAQLGMAVSESRAPFEPEQGAYAGGHSHVQADDHSHSHSHSHTHSHEPDEHSGHHEH